jgi:hypothetical protein
MSRNYRIESVSHYSIRDVTPQEISNPHSQAGPEFPFALLDTDGDVHEFLPNDSFGTVSAALHAAHDSDLADGKEIFVA